MKFLAFFLLVVVIFLSPQLLDVFAEGPKVPVVILFKEKPTEEDINMVNFNGGEITINYDIINGVAAYIPQDKIENLKKDPTIISVDLDVEVHALELNSAKQIRADQVWAAGNTGAGVPVAILDTGIDKTHPEFSGRIILCHNEIFTDASICDDQNGHGTHVAGIIGAFGVDPNAKGISPSASLYVDQVLDSSGIGRLSSVIAGIGWAEINGAKVISMSLATSPISITEPNCDTAFPSLTSAINNAVASGVTVVAAAGNKGSNGVAAPGCISSTIVVGAVDSTDQIASFSSTGGPVADHGIVAPGVNIFSTWIGGYNTKSGTSMATSQVAGTIALMIKANPTLSPSTIRSILFSTACNDTTIPTCPTGSVPNSVYGHGRVDALAAFNAVPVPTVPSAPSGLVATATSSSQISLSWTAPAGGESVITGYQIERAAGTGPFSPIPGADPTPTTATTFSDTGLAADTTYTYRVSAINAIGISVPSNEAAATTLTPDVPLAIYVASRLSDEILRYNEATGAFIDTFVTAASGGLNAPQGLTFGPDGNLYVSSELTHQIIRYDGTTGNFIDVFASTDLSVPTGLTFGPDGNLYVVSKGSNAVVRFDGTTGSSLGAFGEATKAGSGLKWPKDLTFGPDENLYVTSFRNDNVLRYNGITGAFIAEFVVSGDGGLDRPHGLTFGPDGNLYVSSSQGPNNKITRYDGTTGNFIDVYASGGALDDPKGIVFGDDDNLYITNEDDDNVIVLQGPFGASPGSLIQVIVTTGSGGLDDAWDVVFGPV